MSWRIYEKKKDVSDNYRIFLSSVSYRSGRYDTGAKPRFGFIRRCSEKRRVPGAKLSADLYKQLHKVSGDTEDWIPLLAASMAEEDFYPEKISNNQELYRKYKPEEFQLLVNTYRAVWEDVKYFPLRPQKLFLKTPGRHRELMEENEPMKEQICLERFGVRLLSCDQHD